MLSSVTEPGDFHQFGTATVKGDDDERGGSFVQVGDLNRIERPEIILEVQEAKSGKWVELQFKFKPGRLGRAPPLVSPYQPRLDWQMWYQARLQNPQPWFVAFLESIRRGRGAALNLLDTRSLLEAPISDVRIRRYMYTYSTELSADNTWWSRRLLNSTPVTEMLRSDSDLTPPPSSVLLKDAANKHSDGLRSAVVIVVLATAVLFASKSLVSRLWRDAQAQVDPINDHGQPDQSALEHSRLSLTVFTTTGLLVVVLSISWLATLRVIDMISIWFLVIAGLAIQAIQALNDRVAAKQQRVGANGSDHIPEVEKPGLAGRVRGVVYMLVGTMATIGMLWNYYVCWLVFGAGAIAGMIVTVWRIWILESEVPPTLILCLAVDIGLLVMLLMGNERWAS